MLPWTEMKEGNSLGSLGEFTFARVVVVLSPTHVSGNVQERAGHEPAV